MLDTLVLQNKFKRLAVFSISKPQSGPVYAALTALIIPVICSRDHKNRGYKHFLSPSATDYRHPETLTILHEARIKRSMHSF